MTILIAYHNVISIVWEYEEFCMKRQLLEDIYICFNQRDLVHPDPLEFLYNYDDIKDREIVGLIASSLAYGRIQQILKSVSIVLNKINPSPYSFLMSTKEASIKKQFAGFKHRFTTDKDLLDLVLQIKHIITEHGSIKEAFLSNLDKHKTTPTTILKTLYDVLSTKTELKLIPDPEKGSACKRLNLFLRWMVRKDNVDPGGWDQISASKLIIPLDTHMFKIARCFGFTKRNQANLNTAIEITEAFAKISPDDPVKYDFSLTRFGIRDDMCLSDLKKRVNILK